MKPGHNCLTAFLQLLESGAKTFNRDLADETSIQDASKSFGDQPLDILINCAGECRHPYIGIVMAHWMVAAGNGSPKCFDATVDEFMHRFRISAVGPFLTTKAFYPQLKKSASPLVVNISSSAGSISGTLRQTGRRVESR